MGNIGEQPPKYDLEKAHAEADEMKKMKDTGGVKDYKEAEEKLEKNKQIEAYVSRANEIYQKARKVIAENPHESIGHQLSEFFGIEGDHKRYFPGIPENYALAEKIVDENVKTEVSRDRVNNLNITIRGILAYNLDKIDKDNISAEYIFKPKSLEQEALIDRKGNDLDEDLAEFCKSKNPLEYLRYVIENEKELPRSFEPEKIVKIIDAMKEHIDKEKLDNYTKKYMSGEIAERLIENSSYAKNPESFMSGIYVDVDGTLIQKSGFNEPLLDYLVNTSNNVTIFTNGDIEGKTNELRNLGVPEKFLPVKPKDQYKGKLLEKVFDDQHLAYQGFDALLHISPSKSALRQNLFLEYEIEEEEICRNWENIDKNGEELLQKLISDDSIVKYYPRFVAKKKAQLKILNELKEMKSNK